ncbi:16944_t:CDS:2 [Acaulospora colombiana]|uniref:16944_t:CDS:1 n=1 Tax=Acaulospora colombiana TaxID=27376 RepID=A0ACA9MZM3_9GLOM|nr:16944_t:CDS:2 [Acaulospora colombiana]
MAEAEAEKAMKRLVDDASQLKYIPSVTLKVYLRSANSLLLQANRYKEENDIVNAYKFYMRYATLALEKLPQHQDYKKPEYKEGRLELAKKTNIVLEEIQELKPILKRHFLQIAEAAAAEEEARRLSSQVGHLSQTSREIPTSNAPIAEWNHAAQFEIPIPNNEWNLAEQLKDLHLNTSSRATYDTT